MESLIECPSEVSSVSRPQVSSKGVAPVGAQWVRGREESRQSPLKVDVCRRAPGSRAVLGRILAGSEASEAAAPSSLEKLGRKCPAAGGGWRRVGCFQLLWVKQQPKGVLGL